MNASASNHAAKAIAITGIGAVTSMGSGVETIHQALAAGTSGVRNLEEGIEAPYAWAAKADEPFLRAQAPDHLESQVKFLSGSGLLAAEASVEAMTQAQDAGLDLATIPKVERSLYLAQVDSFDWDAHTFHAGWAAAARAAGEGELPDPKRLNKEETRRTKPFFLLESLKNNAYSLISAWFGMQGPNSSTAGISHSAHGALDMARRAILRGSPQLALVSGGNITTHPWGRVEFATHGLLDAQGAGRIPADGAGALILEPANAVTARGGTPLGWLLATYASHGERSAEGATVDTLLLAVRGALATAELTDPIHTVMGMGGSRLEAVRDGVPSLADAQSIASGPLHGDLGAASDVAETALLLGLLPPGACGLVLQDGVHGQAGATLVRRGLSPSRTHPPTGTPSPLRLPLLPPLPFTARALSQRVGE